MKSCVINPENIINCILPNIGEPSLCYIESGELTVNLINIYF